MRVLSIAVAAVFVVAVLLIGTVTSILLAVSANRLTETNQSLVQQLDATNVKVDQLENEKKNLQDQLAQAEETISKAVLADSVFWCTTADPSRILEDHRPFVGLTLRYLNTLKKDVSPENVCFDFVGLTTVEFSGERYLPVRLGYAGGALELYIIYFNLESQGDDKYAVTVLGHYNVNTKQWFPVKR